MTAPAADLDAYVAGWVDGLARRPLASRPEPDECRYTSHDLAVVFELAQRLAREERPATGVDADVIALGERITNRLQQLEEPTQPVRRRRAHPHLRIVR